MDEAKVAENAQLFIDDGFEPERAWKLARLAVKPHEERTDEETGLITQAMNQVRDNTLKLIKGRAYAGKLELELQSNDWFNELFSGLEEGVLKKNYREAGYPYENTEEGLLKWQAELEQRYRIEERLQQILENME